MTKEGIGLGDMPVPEKKQETKPVLIGYSGNHPVWRLADGKIVVG